MRRSSQATVPYARLIAAALVCCSCGPGADGGGSGGGDATGGGDAAGGGSGTGGGSAAGGGGSPRNVSITFDELMPTTGVNVSPTQYDPDVEFIVDAGLITRAYEPPNSVIVPSAPMELTVQNADSPGQYSLEAPLELRFPEGASSVRFFMIGVNSNDTFAEAFITHRDGGTETVPIVGSGTPAVALPVDLSAYGSMSNMRIQNIHDFDGTGYDSFTFTVP
jgi:hypothetical protein